MCHAEYRKAAIITLEGSDWSGIFTTFFEGYRLHGSATTAD